MRIALTHNLRRTHDESQAEFDSPETIAALTASLQRLGHVVEAIDVMVPLGTLLAQLKGFAPDLVFNTAEGERRAFREAFYPALFEQLGLAYTASDPHSLTITLDKHLTKLLAARMGVRTPDWQLITCARDLACLAPLRLPAIIKPNFEGSSKGITQDSVAQTLPELLDKTARALAQWPEGVIVEQFIAGRDITIPFLEGAETVEDGLLPPCEYVIDPAYAPGRRYQIYDYDLKGQSSHVVNVQAPARLAPEVLADMRDMAHAVLRGVRCRDVGRLDFRLADTGVAYFLELNGLPSLEAGSSLWASAALSGLDYDAVIATILRSARRRAQHLAAQATIGAQRA